MKHRVIAALLILAALLSFLPTVQAAQTELTYTLRDGQAIITGASGEMTGQLLIPEQIEGYPVAEIADGAFEDEQKLISVVIQAKLERLDGVFRNCRSLTEAVLPEGLIRLNGTFSGCEQLAEISLPATVRYLDNGAFRQTALHTIRLPDGLREIGDFCFYGVPLTELKLPNGLERIGQAAFSELADQTTLSLPASVKFIGEDAFGCKVDTVFVRGTATNAQKNPFPHAQRLYCHRNAPIASSRSISALTVCYEELSYDPELYPLLTEGEVQYRLVDGAAVVVRAAGDGALTVPSELGGAPVTELEPLCFYRDGDEYPSIRLPDTVRKVGRRAVYAKTANLPQQLQYAGDSAFSGVTLTGTPQFLSLIVAGEESFRGCGLTEAVFGTALRSIGRQAFAVNDLRTVTLAEGVETLGAEAFAWNAALSELTVPSTVTQCDDCLKNSEVSRVSGHPNSAMEAYCERAEIPFVNLLTGEEGSGTRLVTVDHIKYKIFPSGKAWIVGAEARYLTGEVVIPATVEDAAVERICDSALAYCAATTIRLPETLRVVEDWAFLQCSELSYVEIPERLETLLGTPFAACEKLRLLYLPTSFRRSSAAATHLYGLEVLTGYAGTEAEQLARDEGLRFVAIPENSEPLISEKGVFAVDGDGLTALYVRPTQSNGTTSVVVPDEVKHLPVTRLAAGSVGSPNSAVLGANVRYVEDGAFSVEGEPARLTQLVVPPSVSYLPREIRAGAALTVFGTTGTYAERYAQSNGYRFLDRATTPFGDVARSAWYHDAVRTVYWNGLMNGISDSTFAPNGTTTRAMVAKVLANLSGVRDFIMSYGFRDVPTDAWYADAVDWGATVGIIRGTSKTTFSPDDNVTREQLATFLYRFAGACGMDVSARAELSGYDDGGMISSYAVSAMQWAVANGILRGTSARTLNPTGYATRAEIAQMLCNFMKAIGQGRTAKNRTAEIA